MIILGGEGEGGVQVGAKRKIPTMMVVTEEEMRGIVIGIEKIHTVMTMMTNIDTNDMMMKVTEMTDGIEEERKRLVMTTDKIAERNIL